MRVIIWIAIKMTSMTLSLLLIICWLTCCNSASNFAIGSSLIRFTTSNNFYTSNSNSTQISKNSCSTAVGTTNNRNTIRKGRSWKLNLQRLLPLRQHSVVKGSCSSSSDSSSGTVGLSSYSRRQQQQQAATTRSPLSLLQLRAGAASISSNSNSLFDSADEEETEEDDDDIFGGSLKQQQQQKRENYEVVVNTIYGSQFLDKKKKLSCRCNDTILQLKQQLQVKFPGSPSVPLQRIYFGDRLLRDEDTVGNITEANLPVLSLQLDMMSGTSVYNKSMSVSQALEAYAASIVQQTYLTAELHSLYCSSSTSDSDSNSNGESSVDRVLQAPYYSRMFAAVNRSLHEQYSDDISSALEAEKEPDVFSAETAAWRGTGTTTGSNTGSVTGSGKVSPLAAAIAKEFDLNWRGLRSFLYYSGILMAFALFGTSASWNAQILLAIIPLLWLSKLRQLRLLMKITLYTLLPIIHKLDFLMPLLPAPLQVIAAHSASSQLHFDDNSNSSDNDNDEMRLDEENEREEDGDEQNEQEEIEDIDNGEDDYDDED